MPFVPFKSTKDQTSDPAASAAPSFSKRKPTRGRRKTGKVAPAQKALMSSGRSLSGGSR